MESYSVKHKRIRGRDGGSYLALTKNGKIRTRVRNSLTFNIS